MDATTSLATTPVSPIDSATRSAARPCTHAPHTAASNAGTPRARKPAITPVRTSPEPAVASAAPPVSLSAIRPGRPPIAGSAITVPGPFSRTTRRAAVGESLRGRDPIVAHRLAREARVLAFVGRDDRRRAEGLARAQRLEIAVERVEPVGVEHERDACLGDEREHGLAHRGVGAEPGPERERAEP